MIPVLAGLTAAILWGLSTVVASRSTRMSGDFRILPVLDPRVVKTMTGSPRRVVPSVPPDDSIRSTWSRTHCCVLGSYSPSRGMGPSNLALAIGSTR